MKLILECEECGYHTTPVPVDGAMVFLNELYIQVDDAPFLETRSYRTVWKDYDGPLSPDEAWREFRRQGVQVMGFDQTVQVRGYEAVKVDGQEVPYNGVILCPNCRSRYDEVREYDKWPNG